MLVKITRCLRCNKELKNCTCSGRQTDGTFKETLSEEMKSQIKVFVDNYLSSK